MASVASYPCVVSRSVHYLFPRSFHNIPGEFELRLSSRILFKSHRYRFSSVRRDRFDACIFATGNSYCCVHVWSLPCVAAMFLPTHFFGYVHLDFWAFFALLFLLCILIRLIRGEYTRIIFFASRGVDFFLIKA